MSYEPPYSIVEVLRLNAEGLSHSQIASRFDRSELRVRQIVIAEQRRVVAEARAMVIRNAIKASNDIDRKLPIPDLLCVLNLSKKSQAILMKYFAGHDITEFSLRDVMTFLIPVVTDDQADFYDHMPAYRVRMLGQIHYANMIKAMSAVDCGEAFRAEWTARKEMLREYLVRTKGFHNYVLHGKEAALAVHQPIP